MNLADKLVGQQARPDSPVRKGWFAAGVLLGAAPGFGPHYQTRPLGGTRPRHRRAHHRLVGAASLLTRKDDPMRRIFALALLGLAVVLQAAPMIPAARAQTIAAEETVTFAVDNMTCALCPVTVKRAIAGVEGVRAVDIDFAARTATVVFDAAVTSAEAISTASTNTGNPAIVRGRRCVTT